MKKLILTSSVNRVAKHVTEHHDMTKNKLAFIYTAAEVEVGGHEADWNQNDRHALVAAGFNVFDYTLTDKTKDVLQTDLAEADVLYFSGGNTFYLLQQSIKSGFIDIVEDLISNQGKVYMGTSAGSIIAGPKLPEYLLDLGEEMIDEKLLEATGYGLVNFTILPHWGSQSFKKRYLESRLEIIYSREQAPLVLLTDTQFVVVENESMKIVNTNE